MTAPVDEVKAPPDWLAALDRDFAENVVDVEPGVEVGVRTSGGVGAPPVVLLHGIGSGSASWLRCAERLAGSARVIAWDAPGYGASTPLAADAPRADAYAMRLLALLDAASIDHCLLVGHSLGALMATAFAHLAPSRVDRLVLLSPAAGYGTPERETRGLQARADRLQALESIGIEGVARARGSRLVSEHADDDARQWARWNMSRLHERGYRQAIELLTFDHIERYEPLSVPVEVHVGALDGVTLPDLVASIAARLNAPFTLIPDAGHACHIEQPGTVASLLLKTLRP